MKSIRNGLALAIVLSGAAPATSHAQEHRGLYFHL
jgi:hypothetical protein